MSKNKSPNRSARVTCGILTAGALAATAALVWPESGGGPKEETRATIAHVLSAKLKKTEPIPSGQSIPPDPSVSPSKLPLPPEKNSNFVTHATTLVREKKSSYEPDFETIKKEIETGIQKKNGIRDALTKANSLPQEFHISLMVALLECIKRQPGINQYPAEFLDSVAIGIVSLSPAAFDAFVRALKRMEETESEEIEHPPIGYRPASMVILKTKVLSRLHQKRSELNEEFENAKDPEKRKRIVGKILDILDQLEKFPEEVDSARALAEEARKKL